MIRVLTLVAVVGCECPTPPPDASTTAWREGPNLPEGRRRLEATVAALGTRVVVLGGFSTSMREGLAITDEVLVYDTLEPDPALRWSVHPIHAPVAWTHAHLAGIGGSLYLLGGLEGRSFVPSGKTYVLDPDDTAWDDARIPDVPAGLERGAAAVVVAAPHIYLAGGATASGVTASVLEYRISDGPEQPRWYELPPLPLARSHASGMVTSDGTLIVAGGVGPQNEALGDAWALPPDDGDDMTPWMWRPLESMPTRRGGCAYGVILDRMVCAGGETADGPSTVVEAFDPQPAATATSMWEAGEPMPAPRGGAPGVVVGNKLYIPGGSLTSAFEPLETLLIYAPLDTVAR